MHTQLLHASTSVSLVMISEQKELITTHISSRFISGVTWSQSRRHTTALAIDSSDRRWGSWESAGMARLDGRRGTRRVGPDMMTR